MEIEKSNNFTKNYITCQLVGRTGNIMFEIAHAFAKSLEYNRQFIAPNSETSSKHLESNILRKIDFRLMYSNQNESSKSIHAPFHYVELEPYEDCPTIFKGYYQSEKYFKKYTEVIKDLFSPTEEFKEKAYSDFPFLKDSIVGVINVRRGDYLTMPNRHPVISIDYINEAYKNLPKCDKILILSDDIEWCKTNIKLDNDLIFVENYLDYNGLWLISLCHNFIISNSSFSWWGAYLSRYENKKIIAPDIWVGPEIIDRMDDIWCDDWVKIPCQFNNGNIILK